MMGEGRRVFLHTEYPFSVVWKKYGTEGHPAAWVEITTVIIDEYDSQTDGAVKIEIEDTFGFGSVAGGTLIRATLTSDDITMDRAWKVTG